MRIPHQNYPLMSRHPAACAVRRMQKRVHQILMQVQDHLSKLLLDYILQEKYG